jgi:hypothetical protein
MRNYFKKTDAIDGKKEGSEEDKRFITQILCKIWSFLNLFLVAIL